jgi:glycosyltransferase involved in cell wall biosynthesis
MLAGRASLCLALYHRPKFIPFYFYPVKILDYLAMGTPVIASRLGAIRSLIQDGKNGFLTDNSVQKISTMILRAYKNPRLFDSLSVHTGKSGPGNGERMCRDLYKQLLQSVSL